MTQLEATDARRAFPVLRRAGVQGHVRVTLTSTAATPRSRNGRLLSDTPGPGASAAHAEVRRPRRRCRRTWWRWRSATSSASRAPAEAMPIRICATPDKSDLGRIALDAAQQILAVLQRYYAIKYPFGKLDVVAVPDFAAGAMENTAAIFYRETDLLADAKTASVATRKNIADVIAHEMAHQWFGDLVTMRWWDDLWLNEGFATWMANRPLGGVEAGMEHRRRRGARRRSGAEPRLAASTRPIHARRRDARPRSRSRSTRSPIERAPRCCGWSRATSAPRRSATASTPTSRRTPTATRPPRTSGPRSPPRRGKPVDTHPADVRQPAGRAADRGIAALRGQQHRHAAACSDSSGSTLEPGANGGAPGTLWQVPICIKVPGLERGGQLFRARPGAADHRPGARLSVVGVRQRRRQRLLPHRLFARDAARDGAARSRRC